MVIERELVRHLIEQKRDLEEEIRDALNRFRERSGICVEGIYLDALETTNIDSVYRVYGDYQVTVRLDLP